MGGAQIQLGRAKFFGELWTVSARPAAPLPAPETMAPAMAAMPASVPACVVLVRWARDAIHHDARNGARHTSAPMVDIIAVITTNDANKGAKQDYLESWCAMSICSGRVRRANQTRMS